MQIQFLGAAREVTGSKHLITTSKGKRILLDCGMYQGKGLETDAMNRDLGFDPRTIDYLVLTHAHIDHSGLIPYIYNHGFRGSVICTSATRDLCALMLRDSAHIQEKDTEVFNKKRAFRHEPPVNPLYRISDAENCMNLFISVSYGRRFYMNDEISVKFTNTGHMLGSAAAHIRIIENGKPTNITFTGDLGRLQNPLLQSPEPFPPCDYLIAESTYGNRLHGEMKEVSDRLLEIIRHTCVDNKGPLIIPSFAIGRTQDIVYALNNLFNEGRLPKIQIFVDSPLAVNACDIFRLHTDGLNNDVRNTMLTDPDPFGFNSLHYIKEVEDSKRLNSYNKPCVIISPSGMLEAGRVKHHFRNHVEDPRCSVLIVGYCSPNTLGARIQRPGLKEVSIFGKMYEMRAGVDKIEAYSGHGDYREMISTITTAPIDRVKKLFLVHGEYDVQCDYRNTLQTVGYKEVEIPRRGDRYELE